MANSIFITGLFERKYKKYAKKFRSLPDELRELQEQLLENPHSGTELGGGIYKIRLASKSKGKGKSGGFRVITYIIERKKVMI